MSVHSRSPNVYIRPVISNTAHYVWYSEPIPVRWYLEIVELSCIGGFSSQNGIFHSNGHNFASRKDFLASPEVLESRSSRLHDAQKFSSIRPLRVKCELVRYWIDSKSYNDFEPTFLETAQSEWANSKKFVKNNARSTKL